MEDAQKILADFNYISVAVRMLLAIIMGGLIGSERGRHGRAAGLRTHILICIGAALTALTGLFLFEQYGQNSDIARLSAQVISGIGFLGAGIIMVRNGSVVTGLTTAAGMWATAAIGIGIGYGFYEGAVIATVICIFSFTVLNRLEHKRKKAVYVYIELGDVTAAERVIDAIRLFDDIILSYDIIPAKSGNPQNMGILCLIKGEEYYLALRGAVSCETDIILMVCNINS